MKPQTQSPGTTPSSGPRLRRWAARLSLLVAAVASVATSQPSSDYVHAQHTGTPFTVATGAPVEVRDFIVRATTPERSSHTAALELDLSLTGRWKPADASNPGRPVVKLKLFLNDIDSVYDAGQLMGAPGQDLTGDISTSDYGCTLEQECEWRWRLQTTLEFEGEPVDGVLEVDWGVKAASNVEGTNDLPRNYTLRIEEP